MIRYALKCDQGHAFEGWFRSIADYEKQEAAGAVECTACGSTKVERDIMAPALGAGVAAAGEKHTGGPDCPLCAKRSRLLAKTAPEVPDLAQHAREHPDKPAKGYITHKAAAELRAEGLPVYPITKEDA